MGTNPRASSWAKPWLTGWDSSLLLAQLVTQILSSPKVKACTKQRVWFWDPCVHGRASWFHQVRKPAGAAVGGGWSSHLRPGLCPARSCASGWCRSVEGLQKWLPTSSSHFFSVPSSYTQQITFFFYLHMTKRFLSKQITERAGFLLLVVQILHDISYQLQKVREIMIALLTSGLAYF